MAVRMTYDKAQQILAVLNPVVEACAGNPEKARIELTETLRAKFPEFNELPYMEVMKRVQRSIHSGIHKKVFGKDKMQFKKGGRK